MKQEIEMYSIENEELIVDYGVEFEVFDKMIPDAVLKARSKRIQRMVHQNKPDPEKEDIYYMIEVNCTHRPPIKKMVAKVREIKVKLDEYQHKWAKLKVDLN